VKVGPKRNSSIPTVSLKRNQFYGLENTGMELKSYEN